MRRNGVGIIATVVLAAIVLFVAIAGIVFRLNNFKIVFSVPTDEVETVEYGSEYAAPEVKAYLKGKIFYKKGKEIEVSKEGAVNTGALGSYNLSWSASAMGITDKGEHTVNVVDTHPPVLTLNPAKVDYIYVGENWNEPGFTAVDEVDGDVTAGVTVSSIDTKVPGVKEVTYTVTDKSGNSVSAVRNVVIKERPKPKVISAPASSNGGVIYLTFDDGPGRYTAQLLDVLAKYNVKATFFVTGRGDRSLIAREAREGHTVAIHSLTHNYQSIYSSEEGFFKDIEAMNEIIKEQTGSYTKLLRFPGGSSNTVSRKYSSGIMTRLTAAVTEKGYKYFDWNVASGDAGETTSTDKVFRNVTNGVRGKAYSIVLQHDIKGFSVNAVENIIVWGLNNGYTFAPLTMESPTIHQRVNN